MSMVGDAFTSVRDSLFSGRQRCSSKYSQLTFRLQND
jgi:hypothetical protein